LHPKGAEEGCRDRQQKMAKNFLNWLFTPERSRRRLQRSTTKNGYKFAIYTRKEQMKAAEIDTNKMAKNSTNLLFTPERSRRRLLRSTTKNG